MQAHGFVYKPSKDKFDKWVACIQVALNADRLFPGQTIKIAGKLSWGVTKLFNQFGRAMLRPIFDQHAKRNGVMDFELRRCLTWWIGILRNEIVEVRLWKQPEAEVMHVFCDARGHPAHLGGCACFSIILSLDALQTA